MNDDREAAALLQAAFEQGVATWPDISLPLDTFANHLNQLGALEAGGEMANLTHFADLYLACAAGHHIQTAILLLERDHVQRLPPFIRKLRADPTFVDEVMQAVRSKLLVGDGAPPKILEYAGRGSLGAWLRVIAIRTGQTMLRGVSPQSRRVEPDSMEDVLAASTDPELQMLRSRLGSRVTEVFLESLQGLSAEQRNLLRLHYFEGLSFERMGTLFRVNRATACRWVAEARRSIVESTRKKLREELGLKESELDAVTRLLRSQLDISMSKFFVKV